MENYDALLEALGVDERKQGQSTREREAYRMAEPDPESPERSLQWTPELQLMLAILEDAIACYCKTLKRPRRQSKRGSKHRCPMRASRRGRHRPDPRCGAAGRHAGERRTCTPRQ